MITIPAALQTEIIKTLGRHLTSRLTINYSSAYGDDGVRACANDSIGDLYNNQSYNGREDVSKKWASADGSLDGSGTYYPLPATAKDLIAWEVGYWSESIAMANKSFQNYQPVIYGTQNAYNTKMYSTGLWYPKLSLFFSTHGISVLRISFDNARDEYAEDFTIELLDIDGVVKYTENIIGNTGTKYVKDITIQEGITRMNVILKKWSVVGNAKVAEAFSSIQEVYNGSDLMSLQIQEGFNNDAVSAGRMVARIYNAGRKFDTDNTASPLYGYVRRGVRMYPEIGDGINWIGMGEYYAEAWDIRRRDLYASVTGVDKVALLQASEYAESKILTPPTDTNILIDSDAEFLDGTYSGFTVSGGLKL